MFSINVDALDIFLDLITQFTEFMNDEICLKITPSEFSIIARYGCPLFFAMMVIPPVFFSEYSVDRNHNSKISLQYLHNAVLEAESFSSSMTMQLQEQENNIHLIFLPSRPSALPLHHELTILPMEDWSLGEVALCGDKILSVEADMYSHIITTFSVYNEADSILITLVGSQATFSVVPFDHEITVTQESGDCVVFLGDTEVESHMHMPLHPSSFFSNCGDRARRVWFYETDDSCTIMHFPYEVYGLFLMICFPFTNNANSSQD